MSGILVFLSLVICLLVFLFGVFLVVRSKKRLDKNVERGLLMTNLRIYLPPVSEDVDSKTRDSRDVVEENISRATSLYNLLTSTAEKKGFEAAYYGQDHMGFEIIAKAGETCFYAVAPDNLVPVIRQAINSTYPSAKVEEVPDHNLFDPQIEPQSVLGGELALKEDYAYPIATYLDSRQDIMRALLGALTDLQGGDGAGIQILLRPATKGWTKKAQAVAKGLGNQKQDNFFKDLLISFFKNPESKPGDEVKKKEISNLDKNLIEAIEKKITQPGFEVLIRVVASTDDVQKSRNVYNNILAAFALTNAPKSNGFQHSPAKKIDKFVREFNLCIFPQNVKKNILNTNEMATIFHIPDATNIPTSQLERQTSKQIDGPRNFLKEGLLLGHNVFRGNKRAVTLGDDDRLRHAYIIGQTGTGKSVLLENLVLQDMAAGKGFALVDPHGETAEKVLSRIPEDRLDDVIYFNPGNMEYPMGLNIFEHEDEDKQDSLIQEAIAMLYKLYDPNRQGMMGSRYEHIFRNAAKLVMADPAGGTFIDIPKLFNDRQFVEQKLQHVTDRTVIDFWRKEMVDLARSSEYGDLKNWFVSKFGAFLSNSMMRNIIGQNKSSFDFRQIMDEGKMMIINLSLGRTGELNMNLLGLLFVAKFQMAAMSRADVAESERPDFTLYVDEFQNFATESFANIFSEARKYRLALIVANQHTTQLTDEIRHSVLGNVSTAISFRINADDAENMIKQYYHPTFTVDDLTRLPVGKAVVRSLVSGAPTQAFNMETLPPPTDYDRAAKNRNEKLLLKRHGRPRAEVEKEIFDRLEVRTPAPPPGYPSLPPNPNIAGFPNIPSGKTPIKTPPKSMQTNQFLEDWLAKRQALKDDLLEKKAELKKELDKRKALAAKFASEQEEPEKDSPHESEDQSEEKKKTTSPKVK